MSRHLPIQYKAPKTGDGRKGVTVPTVTTPRDESPDSRFEFWRATVGRAFVPLDARPRETPDFHAGLQTAQVGAVQVSVVTADPHSVLHTREHLTSDAPDYCKLNLQLDGRCMLEQHDRRSVLNPGDVALYDTRYPYVLDMDARYRMLVLMFPRAMLRLPEPSLRRITASAVSCHSGLGAVVLPFLGELADRVAELEAMASPRLADNVVDLLGTLLAERSGRPEAPNDEGKTQLTRRILAYMDQRLADPDLGPDRIAAYHHISRRYLYKLMAEQGSTVSGWIRQRRLEQCRRDLASPALAAVPVSAIGSRWGFPDPAHFSHAFKAAYGMSPREARELRETGVGATA